MASNALDLLRARTSGTFCGSSQVIDLGRQIVPAQRHPEQELHAGHHAVAVEDAGAALDQMQLEAAHIVGRCRLGRAPEERREQLAGADMAALRGRPEIAGSHVLDHALAQRRAVVGVASWGAPSLSEVADPSILKAGLPAPLSQPSQLVTALSARHPGLPAQRAVAQRLRAMGYPVHP